MGRDLSKQRRRHFMETTPLDRFAVHDALWSELADEIYIFALCAFAGNSDSMGDAAGDAFGWLLDEITGNACTPGEAISMARERMTAQPDAEYEAARELDAVYQAISTMPGTQQLGLMVNLILDSADPLLLVSDLWDRVKLALETGPDHRDVQQAIVAICNSTAERMMSRKPEADDDRC
jgi:hypothetical protein